MTFFYTNSTNYKKKYVKLHDLILLCTSRKIGNFVWAVHSIFNAKPRFRNRRSNSIIDSSAFRVLFFPPVIAKHYSVRLLQLLQKEKLYTCVYREVDLVFVFYVIFFCYAICKIRSSAIIFRFAQFTLLDNQTFDSYVFLVYDRIKSRRF